MEQGEHLCLGGNGGREAGKVILRPRKRKKDTVMKAKEGKKEFQDERDESTTSNIESSTKTRNQIIGSSNSESLVTVV